MRAAMRLACWLSGWLNDDLHVFPPDMPGGLGRRVYSILGTLAAATA
jgi:hypothetical protein